MESTQKKMRIRSLEQDQWTDRQFEEWESKGGRNFVKPMRYINFITMNVRKKL